ncbi:response regulator transcription factor [Dawidia soli]|uniref:Response regulator transcription factor n=1 Tax=Dawidia soli TaxID=2782352 RepID=A0AAP2DBB8_9BACT|nr:response regulator transcription factor [Dawidia soli]MBT1688569.1 response regulator transcription factor [Dawidia soli]
MEKKHTEVVTVVIIDDHRLFNDGLKAMLAPEQTIDVLAQVYDSREAKDQVRKLAPDVVLMDFNMPHLDGIELTRLLLGVNPDLKILILSMYNEERHIDSFKSIGARGYVFKTASSEEVVQAIRDVYAGGAHFPAPHAESNHADDNFLKKLKLSNRELEVIQLIKAGMKTKEIAEKLNISFYTVETHRKNIKLKVGLKGEAEFIKFIFEI